MPKLAYRMIGISCGLLLLAGCGTLIQAMLDDLTNPLRQVRLEVQGELDAVTLHVQLEGYAEREENEESRDQGSRSTPAQNQADRLEKQSLPAEPDYGRAETLHLPARETFSMRKGDLLHLKLVPQGSGQFRVTIWRDGKLLRTYASSATGGLPTFINFEL